MDRLTRKRLYNFCDPDEPIAPHDERFVDLDALGARGASWASEVAQHWGLPNRPHGALATSTPGAGVTTELRRLAGRLRREKNLVIARVDAEEVFDLHSSLDNSELLLAIVHKCQSALLEAGGTLPSRALLRRLHEWTESSAPELAHELASGTLQLILAIKSSPLLRAKLRSSLEAHHSAFHDLAQDELTLLQNEARKLGCEGFLVLVDGLEKLAGFGAEAANVLRSAERLFARGAPAMTLPVHTLYTAPLALLLRGDLPLHVLPMIALTDRSGARFESGFQTARRIIERRVPTAALDELLGASTREERIDQLLVASGGSPREIVKLLQSVIAAGPLDGPRFTRTLAMTAEPTARGIPENAAFWLTQVHARKALDLASPGDLHLAAAMMSRGAVLPYRDESAWFDVHPAVLRAAPLAAARERAADRL